MHNKYKILFIGDIYDNHLKRLIRNLKSYNPNAIIDVLSFKRYYENNIDDIKEYVREIIFIKPLPNCLKGVHFFSTIYLLLSIKYRISKVRKRKYDCINIHYPYWLWNICIRNFKKMSNCLLLSPWGSDVYRIGPKEQKRLSKLYASADFVGCYGDRFAKDIQLMFNVPDKKIIYLRFGSDTIDYIAEHIDSASTKEAKTVLHIDGKYAITCGYNGSPFQNHKYIIDAICKCRNSLPKNLVLLFPVTYLHDAEYIDELKRILLKNNLDALFFETYLPVSALFTLRLATDMFIHIQKTDAANSSLKEYILCGKKCLNGSWLKYYDLMAINPLPYHNVESLDSLDTAILQTFHSNQPILSEKTKTYIESLGWKHCIINWDVFFTTCKIQ